MIRGQVIDAGGGEVRIVVDRDTEHYPVVGQWVSLTGWSRTVTRRPNPAIIADPFWGAPHCNVCGEVFHGDDRMVSARGWRVWRVWSRRYRHEWCVPEWRGVTARNVPTNGGSGA